MKVLRAGYGNYGVFSVGDTVFDLRTGEPYVVVGLRRAHLLVMSGTNFSTRRPSVVTTDFEYAVRRMKEVQ